MDLTHYFDRVVLVNLKRRRDRLVQTQRALRQCRWPFQSPQVFAAIDGTLTPPPAKWRKMAGVWGCAQSHLAILEQALRDGVDSILILEDDICFAEDFDREVKKFLQKVPQDWEGLMLGGQHIIGENGWPRTVKPGVVRCLDCERTHCYALRGKYLRALCARWRRGGGRQPAHCDHIMGRDPQMQRAHKVYAPEFFLVGQERSISDVSADIHPRRFWNPPGRDLWVVNLHAPRSVVEALRAYGVHTGYEHDRKSGLDRQLQQIFHWAEKNPRLGQKLLREWMIARQWEVCGDPQFIFAVWHPDAAPSLIQPASLWPVAEVSAESISDALRQMPRKMLRLKNISDSP